MNQLDQIEQWKAKGEKIVFTNGVFDILHVGHVDYLEKAKELGDRLVIGLNSDTSVRTLGKGPERPINPEAARARLLSALRCVDVVIVFEDTTPKDLIISIMPNILAKGGDYDPNVRDEQDKRYIVGSAEVLANGGEVKAIPLTDGFSTTAILEKSAKKSGPS